MLIDFFIIIKSRYQIQRKKSVGVEKCSYKKKVVQSTK